MTTLTRPESIMASPAGERTELVLAHLDQLPMLPATAGRLLAVVTSPDSSASDAARIIESDAAMTATVLRLVRRADRGVRSESMTVSRAVALLGFTVVRDAVLSVTVYEALSDPVSGPRLASMRQGLWRHNLAVACAAEMIAGRAGRPHDAGEAFVCGLLHDVGKIALDACLPKSYARAVERVARRGRCICDAEREVFGLDHTVAGKHLAVRWRLGQAIVDCVWLHHQDGDALPASVGNGSLVQIIHLADHLVRGVGIGYSGYGRVEEVTTLARRLPMDPAALDEIVEAVPQRVASLCDAMGLEQDVDQAAYVAALEAANQQLGRINHGLSDDNRRLTADARCGEALEDFCGRLRGHDRAADVCAAAAGSVSAMLGSAAAVGLCHNGPARCLHVGYAGERGDEPLTSLIDLDAFSELEAVWRRVSAAGCAGGLHAAPNGADTLWRQATGHEVTGTLWMLPLRTTDETTGVVLADAEPSVAAEGAFGGLSDTMGAVLASVRSRVAMERMAEELVHLNDRLRLAQEPLVRSRSVSMIAAMAAGAAHELNNPLAVISGRAQMALSRGPDEESAGVLMTIVEQTERAARIVSELMAFARPPEPVPIRQRLDGVLARLCQRWGGDSESGGERIGYTLAETAVTVFADPEQLVDILEAVVANALEATAADSGRVEINSPSLASDETVRIVVKDNGVGMTRDVLRHAIDPFFSSRPAGRGRGLGLSRAYRLVEVNGGYLTLESKPGGGTTVTIELPALSSEHDEAGDC